MTHYYRLQNGGGRSEFDFAMPGFRACLVHSRTAGETVFEHCEPHHRIIITLDGGTAGTIAEVHGAPTVRRADRAGSITVVPANTRRRVILKNPALSLLTIALAPDFADGVPAGIPLMQNGRDDWLWRAGIAFQSAARSGGELERQCLAMSIGRHVQHMGQGAKRRRTGLDPAALVRVIALMQDRIADNLTLDDFAGECGLSISAFSRAFAQSTGMTPHRYFTALRIKRAKLLLAARDVPLAQVAGVVGYSDQAHFTTAFARHTGLPPARWREMQFA